jgi:DNA-binding MarR family transcriptional regulator
MDLKQMQYFLCLAQEGNVTRAARQLSIVQPALSMQIAKLEKSLGRQLFHRASRGMSLTPAGEALVQRITPILMDIDRVRDEIGELDGKVSGRQHRHDHVGGAEHAAGIVGEDRGQISGYPPSGLRRLFGDHAGMGHRRAARYRHRQHPRATTDAGRPAYSK